MDESQSIRMNNGSTYSPINLQDHAWRYFELHANQRISLFRFYIAILVFYSSAVGFLFVRFYHPGRLAEIAVIVSSFTLAILTGIFQLLDRRNCQLIEYGEKALQDLESSFIHDKETIKIFTLEDKNFKSKKSKCSHKTCFTCLYVLAYAACLIAVQNGNETGSETGSGLHKNGVKTETGYKTGS